MSRLTIEQAISHAREVAEKNKANCKPNIIIIPNRWISDTQCAEEHEQLAGWLEELRRYKDLEEQGRLIELPCEKVYRIINYDSPKYAFIDSIPIEMMPIYDLKHIDNGNIFFSTKEKAEAKLEEWRVRNE